MNKLKQKHTRSPGKLPIFSKEEEEAFVSYISAMSEFGFPLTTQDLRHVIRSFLDRSGRLISYFEKNMPGTLEGLKNNVLPKQAFSLLLKKTLEILEPHLKKNLESGFRKFGIHPCDIESLLQRIARTETHQEAVNATFLDILKATKIACTNGSTEALQSLDYT
ncbi:hypothetical protein ILUMI_02967 [Ignelater luminosus]|uniref:Uncharacterized protein n=1 Tax=Ignelater luminosus TaxID=2038154 RepID=A0A8K0GFZ3_IGNLU|nr:hypothetical protein ILUMI_02967 [Ignelater luminosus]